ncbi:MAG TPA: amidohydrolase family protein [Hyphomicrobiales bacterium]|nr:amidohydrolase family protein [Hyphomicrobiales bacterium]
MSMDVLERPVTRREVKVGIVDCDIHPTMNRLSALYPYLDERWHRHIETFGVPVPQAFAAAMSYPRWGRDGGNRLDSRPPNGGAPGSDLAFMQEQHLDPNNIELGVLQPMRPQAINQRNIELGVALASAVNDWQVATWCEPEPRLKGSLIVPQEDPAAAIVEIERHAGSPHFVQVGLSPRGIEPLGRKRYWPVYEAAEAHGMPIGIHVGGFSGRPPSNLGWHSFYIEDHHLTSEAMQALVMSFVLEGVFEQFPRLKLVLIEGGFVWCPSLCWRMDKNWKILKSEVPHLKRAPSEYVREHIWFTTQPVDEPADPSYLADMMEWLGWDRILFSTDYPHWDFDDPKFAFKTRLGETERKMIFRDNARALYGVA